MSDETFCGCCGNASKGEFCSRCRPHLLPINGHRHAWDRTYYAQFQKDCPYQDPATSVTKARNTR